MSDYSTQKFHESLNKMQGDLNIPEPNTIIWRYYSLESFLSLITSNSLFFAPSSSFEDPFEGDYGEHAKEEIRLKYGDGQYLRDFNTYRFLRNYTYISCWHESEHESDSMWKLYGNSIAIKSIFINIRKLLSWSQTEIKQASRVNYIDYSVEHINVDFHYMPYFFKRNSFSHEKEIRFLIQEHRYDWNDYPEPSHGKTVPLNFNSDIEEIVLSPTMHDFVCTAIETMIKQLDLTPPVRRSQLLNKPVW